MANTDNNGTDDGHSSDAIIVPTKLDIEQLSGIFVELATKHASLRSRLIAFFRRNRKRDPEMLADSVFPVLIKKLLAGVSMDSGLEAYCHGIAKLILLESTHRPESAALYDNHAMPAESGLPAGLNRIEAKILLDRCAAAVPAADYEIWRRYHDEDRHKLAEELGISKNALRIRVHRITQAMIAAVRNNISTKATK